VNRRGFCVVRGDRVALCSGSFGLEDMKSRCIVAILAAAFLGGCSGVTYPPEGMVYKPAFEAVKAAKDLPAGAVVDPRHEAKLYIAKNAAQAEMPYEYTDASGQKITDIYLVYLKRVNRRWELDRCFPLPKYPVSAKPK